MSMSLPRIGAAPLVSRRDLIQGGVLAASGLWLARRARAAEAGGLKISHQFPGGTGADGDFRDRLCRRFAADVEKRQRRAEGRRSIRARR